VVLQKDGAVQLGRLREKLGITKTKEERNVLRTIKGKKANWIGHILRRNCLLKTLYQKKRGKTRKKR
jgi:hypothetical protein